MAENTTGEVPAQNENTQLTDETVVTEGKGEGETTTDNPAEIANVFLTDPAQVSEEVKTNDEEKIDPEMLRNAFQKPENTAGTEETEETDRTGINETHARQITRTTDGVGILNFEEHFPDKVPVFTEMSTIVAMQRLAIEPKELLKPKESDLQQYENYPDVKGKVEEIFNQRRQGLINDIINERENVLDEQRRKRPKTQSETLIKDEAQKDRALKDTIDRIEKLQKKQIEQLIVVELIHAQAVRDEEERQSKRDQRQLELAEQVKQKQKQESEKRKAREQVLLQRLEEKEKDLAEKKRKQEEKVERNQKLLADRKAQRHKELSDAEAVRQKKAAAQRDALQRQLEEQKRDMLKKQKEAAIKERMMEQKRMERLNELKERNQKAFEEKKQRMLANRQREIKLLEDKRKSVEMKQQRAQTRYDTIVQRRLATSQQIRAKSELQYQRNREVREGLEKETEKKVEALLAKEARDDERRNAILAKTMEFASHNRAVILERRAVVYQRREEQRLLQEQHVNEILKKQEKSDKHLSELKQAKNEEMAKRSSIQRIKYQIMEENAERKEKQLAFRIKQREDLMNERGKRVDCYRDLQREIAMERRKASTKLDLKREDVMAEFSDMVSKGGPIDFNRMAKKFDVDVDYLREKVAESKKQAPSLSRNTTRNSQPMSPNPIKEKPQPAQAQEVVEKESEPKTDDQTLNPIGSELKLQVKEILSDNQSNTESSNKAPEESLTTKQNPEQETEHEHEHEHETETEPKTNTETEPGSVPPENTQPSEQTQSQTQ